MGSPLGNGITAVGFEAASRDGELDSLKRSLTRIADLGADSAEIAITSLDIVSGGRIIPERAERFVNLMRQFPLRYTVHGMVDSNFMDPVTLPMQLAVAKSLVQLCDMIGAKILVQHSGALLANQIEARAGAALRERDALAELAEFARPHGVRIALENIYSVEPGEYRLTPAEVARQVAAVDHPNLVGLLDFSHAYIEATYRGLDLMSELRAMAAIAGHLHVHDSFGRPQGNFRGYYPQELTAMGLGDLHLPVGWGDFPWDAVFAELKFLPDTVLVMEIGERYAAELAQSLKRARSWVATAHRPQLAVSA